MVRLLWYSFKKMQFSPELCLAHQKAFTASQFVILFCHITRARSHQLHLSTCSGEGADTVLVTGSCRQRGVASGQAKVTNHRVQQLCDTNFHLHSVSVIIMQLHTTTLQHLDWSRRLRIKRFLTRSGLLNFNKSSYPASAARACPLHFFRSWCLTMKKGAPNPLPKNTHIFASSVHLLSTENGRF